MQVIKWNQYWGYIPGCQLAVESRQNASKTLASSPQTIWSGGETIQTEQDLWAPRPLEVGILACPPQDQQKLELIPFHEVVPQGSTPWRALRPGVHRGIGNAMAQW